MYTTQIIPFNFTENRLGVPWRREAPLSLSCWLCKKPLSLRLPQYLDLCAFYVHNLKSAKAGRASEGGRKCAQISGCFPEDSLTYGLRFLEFGRTPIFGNGQDWMIPVPGKTPGPHIRVLKSVRVHTYSLRLKCGELARGFPR